MFAKLLRAAALSGVLATAACGPSDLGAGRIDDIPENATREAALDALGTGPLTATGSDTIRLANGFRRQMFLSNGKNYEVIFYREAPGSLSDDINRELETPVVLQDGKYIGSGWKFYSELAEREKLPNPAAATQSK